MGIIVQPAWSFLADARGGVRGALLGALTGAALLSLLIPLGKSYGALLLLLMGWAFFFNGIDPLLNSLALESLGHEADAFGRLRLFGSFGNAGFQLLIGCADADRSQAAMFLWQALFLLVALANVLAITQGGSGRERALGRRGLVVMLLGSRALLLFLPAALLLQTSQVMGWSYFALYMKAQGAGAVEAGVGLWIAVLSAFPFFFSPSRLLSRFGPHRLLLVSAAAYALSLGASLGHGLHRSDLHHPDPQRVLLRSLLRGGRSLGAQGEPGALESYRSKDCSPPSTSAWPPFAAGFWVAFSSIGATCLGFTGQRPAWRWPACRCSSGWRWPKAAKPQAGEGDACGTKVLE